MGPMGALEKKMMGKRRDALRQCYLEQGATEEEADLMLKTSLEGASADFLDAMEELGETIWAERHSLLSWVLIILSGVFLFASYSQNDLGLALLSMLLGCLAISSILLKD